MFEPDPEEYRRNEADAERDVQEHERLEDIGRAKELDTDIDRKLTMLGMSLTWALLELARSLNEMYESQGYMLLGYSRWERYLASKRDYSRSYLSYLLKIGRAFATQEALPAEIGGSQLIEYAKATDFPERIPQLIEATWPHAKAMSVREMRSYLTEYIDTRRADFKRAKSPSTRRARQKPTWLTQLQRTFDRLQPAERMEFVGQLEDLLRDCKVVTMPGECVRDRDPAGRFAADGP